MAYLKLSLALWSVLFWWSKEENDEYLDLTWVSPKYTLEKSKQKKQTLRRSPVYINFCKTVTMNARQNVYFRARSSILAGVESGKTKRQGRTAETLKKMVNLPYLYHFLSVDFKHFSRLKIYRIFFENICPDSSVLRAPPKLLPRPPTRPVSEEYSLPVSFRAWWDDWNMRRWSR